MQDMLVLIFGVKLSNIWCILAGQGRPLAFFSCLCIFFFNHFSLLLWGREDGGDRLSDNSGVGMAARYKVNDLVIRRGTVGK